MQPPSLSLQDIARLVQNPSSETRAIVAEKIGNHINQSKAPNEFQLAIEIAKLLLKDKDSNVRQALSSALKDSTVTPKDIILALANDAQDEVSEPVLQHSPQLSEEDLVLIAKTTERVIRLLAIARRKFVTTRVVGALVERKLEEVSKTLIENPGADFTEDLFKQVAEDFYSSQDIMRAFMSRKPVPVKAVKHMVEVSTSVTKSRITANRDRILVEQENTAQPGGVGDEIRMVISLGNNPTANNAMQIAERFNRSGSLTPIFLSTILLLGNHRLFVACMACRSRVPVEHMEEVYYGDEAGFREFFEKSRLPFGMLKYFRFLRQSIDDVSAQGTKPNSQEFFVAASQRVSQAVDNGIPYANRVGYAAIKMLTDYFAKP